jgi:aminoglycoside/choline kinase family phosphotransferase
VRAFARAHLGADAQIEPLAGDASTRVYYRVHAGDGQSFVVAAHDAPFDAAGFPFLETSRLLAAAGVPAPGVVQVDGAAGLILLEDLGDETLQEVVGAGGSDAPAIDQLYRHAVDLIVRLQQQGTPRLHPGLHAGRQALDAQRFRFELDYFLDNLVVGLRGQTLPQTSRHALDDAMDAFCAALGQEPQVLCHRDFHSRNLMLRAGGALAVVDHQDARRGPDTYDLASLLRDPYVVVPAAREEMLIDHFRRAVGGSEPAAAFRRRFERMAAQRTLKAAGTFAAQQVLHGRSRYLAYLPRVLGLARQALGACPELGGLQAQLAPLVPELAP